MRILVIEDDRPTIELLLRVLEADGHVVLGERTGTAGLERATAEPWDLVISDIGLPDMSGYEVARTLRADRSLDASWLVALTGYAQPDDRERAAEAGFDAHVAKPPSIDALAEAIDGKGDRLRP